MHSNFSDLWLKVAGAEVHALTNFPNEYRALDACRTAFENPFVGLALRSIETDVVPCPYHEEWVSGTKYSAAMADDMFAKYVDLVAEDPAQHAMDYVHSYAHAEKA